MNQHTKPRRSIRIHNLAKEWGVSSKSVIDTLLLVDYHARPGVFIKSASSIVILEPNQAVFWESVKVQSMNKHYFGDLMI